MKIKMEYNDYVLLKPYEIEPQTALIVNSNDTPCLGKVAVDYSVKANGTIDVKASFAPGSFRDAYKDIPRFGLTLEMPEDFK